MYRVGGNNHHSLTACMVAVSVVAWLPSWRRSPCQCPCVVTGTWCGDIAPTWRSVLNRRTPSPYVNCCASPFHSNFLPTVNQLQKSATSDMRSVRSLACCVWSVHCEDAASNSLLPLPTLKRSNHGDMCATAVRSPRCVARPRGLLRAHVWVECAMFRTPPQEHTCTATRRTNRERATCAQAVACNSGGGGACTFACVVRVTIRTCDSGIASNYQPVCHNAGFSLRHRV